MEKINVYTSLVDSRRYGGQVLLADLKINHHLESFRLVKNYLQPRTMAVFGSVHNQIYGYLKSNSAHQIADCIDSGGSAKIVNFRVSGSCWRYSLSLEIELSFPDLKSSLEGGN